MDNDLSDLGKQLPNPQVTVENWTDLIDGIEELKKGFNILINKDSVNGGKEGPVDVNIVGDLPRLVPQPSTHVQIKGVSTADFVTPVEIAVDPTSHAIIASGSKTILSKAGVASSSGNNTLVAAGTARTKVKAFSLTTTSSTAVTCIFQDGASGTALWEVILQAPSSVNVGANLSTPAPDFLFATSSAVLLNLNLSAAQSVYWSVSYWNEA